MKQQNSRFDAPKPAETNGNGATKSRISTFDDMHAGEQVAGGVDTREKLEADSQEKLDADLRGLLLLLVDDVAKTAHDQTFDKFLKVDAWWNAFARITDRQAVIAEAKVERKWNCYEGSVQAEIDRLQAKVDELQSKIEWWQSAVEDATNDYAALTSKLETEYMKLPLDADGVPIHVGDTMTLAHGKSCEVVAVSETQFTANKLGSPKVVCHANLHRHVKPDSLKELLNDRINDVLSIMTSGIPIALETALNDSFGKYGMSDTEYRAKQIAAVAREMARLDLVNVVRCRDCKQFDDRFHYPLCRRDMSCDEIAVYAEPDGFCAWGERKEGGE